MIPLLSEKISFSFIRNGIIAEEDRDVYSYCFELLLATVLNFMAIFLIALATGMFAQTICFLLTFIPLRQFVGGYHAKNHFRCFLILMGVYGTFLLMGHSFPTAYMPTAIFICLATSAIVVFILAPLGDSNKPLSEEAITCLRRKSRIAIILYCIAIGLIYMLSPDKALPFALSLGLLSAALALIASKIKTSIIKHSLPSGKR